MRREPTCPRTGRAGTGVYTFTMAISTEQKAPASNSPQTLPRTLGELRRSEYTPERVGRSVKDELRDNLITRLRAIAPGGAEEGAPLFAGIVGYEDTVVPQVINAVLSRHNFILLGLRGQAKSRILRSLTTLLDPQVPYVAGSELRDNPYAPLSRYSKDLVEAKGEDTPIAWMGQEERYVEKLATPDVTVADLIGDVDPIKAARSGQELGSELTMHYGLLPRANRGIFAINEIPDLAGKIQVALFNIMQEGDVQIKGYPVRLELDVAIVFSANPEDYTARGKIVTPLKDRIGSEIRTHYPESMDEAIAITEQEAWTARAYADAPGQSGPTIESIHIPHYIRQIVETMWRSPRARIRRSTKRSGRLTAPAHLHHGAGGLECRERAGCWYTANLLVVPRVGDIYCRAARESRARSSSSMRARCAGADAGDSKTSSGSSVASGLSISYFSETRTRSRSSSGSILERHGAVERCGNVRRCELRGVEADSRSVREAVSARRSNQQIFP